MPRNSFAVECIAVTSHIEVTPAQDFGYRRATGFDRICLKCYSFTLFLRYQAQSERPYRRALPAATSRSPHCDSRPSASPAPRSALGSDRVSYGGPILPPCSPQPR
jgi:hypothetical protein